MAKWRFVSVTVTDRKGEQYAFVFNTPATGATLWARAYQAARKDCVENYRVYHDVETMTLIEPSGWNS
jgi:hypothetical protein